MAGQGCPAGLGWISGPGEGGLVTWARAPGRCLEQGEKKENIFQGVQMFADQAEEVPACDKETLAE